MSREFPDFIDPWRAAAGGKRIGGTIPLARLKRLSPLLASSEGEATFELLFAVDAQGRPTVAVEVAAPLSLTCQRSLEPYIEQISERTLLQVIGEPAEQALLSDDEEFVLVEEGRVAVADLVEDELLLAVPQVPRNPEAGLVWATTEDTSDGSDAPVRPVDGSGEGTSRRRPFESLAEILRDK